KREHAEYERRRETDRDRALQLTRNERQQLEDRKEIPLRPGYVRGVGRVRGCFQPSTDRGGQDSNERNHRRGDDDVLADDIGPESDPRSLRRPIPLAVELRVSRR